MQITEIIPFGKTRCRVLTDGDLVFVVYKGELRRLHLTVGAELAEETIGKVLLPMLTRRARERLVFLLKDADKTEAELRRKLREGGYPESCIEGAVAWAREKHYVDDRRYAAWYAEYHARGKSRRKLLYDLEARGISREIAEEILEAQPVDEEAQIRKELEKRHFDPLTAEPDTRRKFLAALARKGYSWDTIRRVLRPEQEESDIVNL